MYAEIKVFEDDGTPLMGLPYVMSPTHILVVPEPVKNGSVVKYEFRFGYTRIESDKNKEK